MILKACVERRVVMLLSNAVLAEYAEILHDPELCRRLMIESGEVDLYLRRLRYVSEVLAPTTRFAFPRDPDDEPFIELAIAGQATHLITVDKDLLSLPASRTDAGKRFRQRLPSIQVQTPADFMRDHPDLATP